MVLPVVTPAAAAQAAAQAKLKQAAAAATAAKTPAPILATGKVTTPPKPAPVTLPPGIDFAALKAQDMKNKALQAQKPGGKMANGYYLPPGIDFAALKHTADLAKLRAAPPVDPLQATYDKFSAEMKLQGKDTSALYDRVMKEITDMYGTANKETDADYAPTLAALKQMVTNVGGGANSSSIADVPAEVARLKSMNASNLAGVKSSIDMLKGAIPSMFSSISEGTMGDLQQAMLDRAAAQQAAAAAARGGGGGGGGGGRRRSGGGSGSSSGKTTDTSTASETYDSRIGDVDALNSLSPSDRELFLNVYNLAGRSVTGAISKAQQNANREAAQMQRPGFVPNLITGHGVSNLAKARNSPAHETAAQAWQRVINAFNPISGSLGGATGKRNVKSSSSSKAKRGAS